MLYCRRYIVLQMYGKQNEKLLKHKIGGLYLINLLTQCLY